MASRIGDEPLDLSRPTCSSWLEEISATVKDQGFLGTSVEPVGRTESPGRPVESGSVRAQASEEQFTSCFEPANNVSKRTSDKSDGVIDVSDVTTASDESDNVFPSDDASVFGVSKAFIVGGDIELLRKEINDKNLTEEQERIVMNERRKGKNRLAASNSRKRSLNRVQQLKRQKQLNDKSILEEKEAYERALVMKKRWEVFLMSLDVHLDTWDFYLKSKKEES